MVAVYYNNEPLYVYPVIAERMGLIHGQLLTHETEFWQLIRQNADYCESLMLAKKAGETTEATLPTTANGL